MAILVTGGAGYIGTATVEHLLAQGEEVVVLDDLVRGHRPAIDPEVPFYQGDVATRCFLQKSRKSIRLNLVYTSLRSPMWANR